MILLILKAMTSVLAAAYGIYATIRDFHERRNGRQVLSIAGKRGIAFLLIISAFGIGVDVWKEIDDKRSSADSKQKLAALLKETAESKQKLADVLKETKDTKEKVDPLRAEIQRGDRFDDEWNLSFGFIVDAEQHLVRPFWDRVARDIAKKPDFDLNFGSSAKGFPNPGIQSEATLAEIANFDLVMFSFYKAPAPQAIKEDSVTDYSLTAFCERGKNLRVQQDFAHGTFHSLMHIGCKTEVRGRSTTDFHSYRDLDKAKVSIFVIMGKNAHELGGEFKGVDFKIAGMSRLTSKKGRLCEFINTEQVSCNRDAAAAENRFACFTATVTCP